MELNQVLLWMVGISCAAILVRGIQIRAAGAMGWLIIAVFIEAVMGIEYLVVPQYAGLIGGVIWLALIIVPLLGSKWMRRLLERQQFKQATALARWVRLFHPLDGYWQHPALLLAQHQAEVGELDQALATFDRLRHRTDSIGRSATAAALRLRRQWQELTEWVERELSPRVLQSDFATFISYLRALGEIGNIERLLHTFAQQPTLLHQPALTYIRNMNRLMLFVFTGQPQRAASLLYDGALAELPEGIKQYWLATAEQTAGQTDAADARLDRIFPTASKSLQAATADRKARPLPINPIAQSEASLRLIQQADDDHRHELLYVRAAPHSRRWAVMTLVLIAANVMVFTVEVLRGGATDWDVLYKLGAAETFAVRGGEWWRLFTANFLHFGWLHLAMNMIGLLALGPFVERQFGRIRYAIVYLLAGVLGISYVIFRTIVNARMPEILVGASAAVMGLVGATGAILLVGWWRHRARSAMRRLRGVAMIVGVQILFDAITPQVSGAAHLAGCAAGFLLAIPFCLARREVAEVPTKGI